MTSTLRRALLDLIAGRRLPRTYFHGKSTREGVPHPIDEVVEWARTERGGRQFLLLDTEPPGCVRWGLCETNVDPAA